MPRSVSRRVAAAIGTGLPDDFISRNEDKVPSDIPFLDAQLPPML